MSGWLKEAREREHFSVLDTDSEINTKNPLENEFVSDWARSSPNGTTYLLLGRMILSGSGPTSEYSVSVGDEVALFDDGNGTTRYPFDSSRGRVGFIATVSAIAGSPEEITEKFPPGVYKLRVMK